MGLIREGTGVAAKALLALSVELDATRAQVEQITRRGTLAPPAGHIPFTPGAKTVLELASQEAQDLSHDYIGTEHILLALMREREGAGAQVLRSSGVEFADVRRQIRQLMRRSLPALLTGQDAAQEAVVPALPEGADFGETRGLERLDVGGELVGLRAVVARIDVTALAFATRVASAGSAATASHQPDQLFCVPAGEPALVLAAPQGQVQAGQGRGLLRVEGEVVTVEQQAAGAEPGHCLVGRQLLAKISFDSHKSRCWGEAAELCFVAAELRGVFGPSARAPWMRRPAGSTRCSSAPARLGICTAPRCDRVYVDTSRNGTRRYCSTSCQNRVKTAAFRARLS